MGRLISRLRPIHSPEDFRMTKTNPIRRAGLAAFAALVASSASAAERDISPAPARYDEPIARLSRAHGVPEKLIRRVIMRESRYAPHLTNHGHYGLMQMKLATAKGMGYRGGAGGLLDGETNLTYAVPYLANAYRAADKNEDRAVALYAGGYYYVAKRKGLLSELRTANSRPLSGEQTVAYAEQTQQAPQAASPFAFLFGQAAAPQPAEFQSAANDAQAGEEIEVAEVVFEKAPLPPRRPTNL
jgi:soluble lytic murein transglycosylase-like protein